MTTWDYIKNLTDEELIDLVMDYDKCEDEAIDEMVVRFQKLVENDKTIKENMGAYDKGLYLTTEELKDFLASKRDCDHSMQDHYIDKDGIMHCSECES